jgi:hypothetical protein
VVSGADQSLPSSAGERRYLVGRYAADARWRELWRLVLDLPLAEAAAAAQVFPATWSPRRCAHTRSREGIRQSVSGALPLTGQIVYGDGIFLDAVTLSEVSTPPVLTELLIQRWLARVRMIATATGSAWRRVRATAGVAAVRHICGTLDLRPLRATPKKITEKLIDLDRSKSGRR